MIFHPFVFILLPEKNSIFVDDQNKKVYEKRLL